MKRSVIDIDELQREVPVFRGSWGRMAGKYLMKHLSIDKVNEAYSNSCHLTGADFTSSILQDPLINVQYKVHNKEVLESLPQGAFITVSNHPVGSLDGLILIDIFAGLCPGFKVMVNGVLTRIGALQENFISVEPDSNHTGANLKNVNGLRTSFVHLKGGNPVGFFPAGAISVFNKDLGKVLDQPWVQSIIRIIRKSNVPVYPVHFDFHNSTFFYWLGTINWKIRMLRIPAEVFNKCGKILDVSLRQAIMPEEICRIPDDEELAAFLYARTYAIEDK